MIFETYDTFTIDLGGSSHPVVVGEFNGETWVRVFHHRNKRGTQLFSSKDDGLLKNQSDPENDRYSILSYLSELNNEGSFEFILEYPNQSNLQNKYNHWSQTSNPVTTTIVGYKAIHIDWTTNYWGGLEPDKSANCLIDGSVNYNNWFYAIGSYVNYNNGVPGPDGVIDDGDIDLWLKCDVSKFQTKYKTKYLYSIDGILYNEVEGELCEIEPRIVTEDVLLEYGNDTVNKILLTSVDRIKLYIYNQNPAITGYRFNYTALWKGQTIIQDYDFNCELSKSLKFTATINANDVFKVLLSNDKGITWYGLNEEDDVIEVDIEDIETSGLSINQVNSMTTEKLQEIINESDTLRVAFYMKQSKSNVHMSLDHIRFEYK